MDRFREALVAEGVLTQERAAQLPQEISQSSLVYYLFQEGLVEDSAFIEFYRKFAQCKAVSLKTVKLQDELTTLIDPYYLRKYFAYPLVKTAHQVTLAMVDPRDFEAIEIFEDAVHMRVNPVLCSYSEITRLLDEKFGFVTSVKSLVQNLEQGVSDVSLGSVENEVFQSSSKAGPVNKLLHLVISHALKENASDIHFEPTAREMQCRFRIDGVLSRFMAFPRQIAPSLISSIKVLAKMDIAEKRIPLDGGFQVKIENKIIDLRVSSFPILDGEKIVIRILDKTGIKFTLDGLGMSEQMLKAFLPLITKNNGIVLVTGPTGSGKTTTLYSVLERIKSVEKNIVTIEDPIEYHLDLINQSQVNVKAGLTFARGLRSFLRQDPDILLVGEIRDSETAEISFQAALTGHLVFSTLHTNDAASSLTRLMDMGIEPYLLSSSINGILAQRLTRRICPSCQEKYTPDPEALAWLGIPVGRALVHGRGCEQCKNTGFKGRVGLFELLIPSREINEIIHSQSVTADAIKQKALSQGMLTLKADALYKVLQGFTTAEEVYRVLR
jgi:type IV pilus assembly protein PilB